MVPDLDGMTALRGRLDAESAAMLHAALDPLATPGPTDAHGPDLRNSGQRYADALVELARRGIRAGELPSTGGQPAQIVVTIDEANLRSRLAPAWLDTGDPITPAALRRIACDAGILPAVLDTTSQPLDLGRQTRLISGALRRALILRDHGCAFPTCTKPPTWCDGHQITSWIDGGPTNLHNAVLLCGYHHRLIHKGEWSVRLGHDKRPEFLPPDWIDPHRKPLHNTMHNRR